MAVSLSQGMRNAVYSLGDINDAIAVSNKRLATGKKVNSALDNASAFFRAAGLQKEARDFNSLLDGLERGSKIIQKATKAIEGISKMVESAQALARQARQLADTDTARNTLQGQVAELMTQASRLAYDSGYDGSRLFQVDATALPNVVSADQPLGCWLHLDHCCRSGFPSRQRGRHYQHDDRHDGPQRDDHGWSAAVCHCDDRMERRYRQHPHRRDNYGDDNDAHDPAGSRLDVATQSAVVDIRKSFTKDSARANNEFADYLTLADINEEGAVLTSLQTRQQLSVSALSFAGRTDQAILRLFG